MIIDKLIASELVHQEAQRTGLDKQADYLAKEELTRRELLVNTYLQDYLKKNPISEADIKAAYDKYKSEAGTKEYKAQHIMVATEAKAKEHNAQHDKTPEYEKIETKKTLKHD